MKLLFRQYPLKLFKHNVFLLIIAVLISLGLVLSFISIPIPNVGISISFTWLPTILAGWFFGPIIGLFVGFIIDTLNFLIHGGIWFWMYAIQEPMVGLITGILSGLFYLIFKAKQNIKSIFITFQVFFNLFICFSAFIILYIANRDFNLLELLASKNKIGNLQITTLLIIIFCLLFVFYLVIQIIACIKYKNLNYYQSDSIDRSFNFYYACIICCMMTLIFSFLLGPISAIEYYKYLNNKPPSSFIKYGLFYYLIPRIIKECFKTPLYIFILWLLIYSLNSQVERIKNQALNKW